MMAQTTEIMRAALAPTGRPSPLVPDAAVQLAERAAIEAADRHISENYPAVAALLADTDTAREHDDEPRLYLDAAAAYVGRSIEAEALRTDNVGGTLDNCADALPHIMSTVFTKLNMDAALATELSPLLDWWLRSAARMHHARVAASAPLREVLDIMLDAIRRGADPAVVAGRVLELIEQVRAASDQTAQEDSQQRRASAESVASEYAFDAALDALDNAFSKATDIDMTRDALRVAVEMYAAEAADA